MSVENLLDNPIVQNAITARIYGTSVFVAYVWEWITTVGMERRRIWKSDWSFVKGVFLWLRYCTLVLYPISLAGFDGNWTLETCKTLKTFEMLIGLAIILPAETLLLMRAYAIWQRNHWILLVGLIGLILIGVGQILSTVHAVPVPFPPGVDRFACIAAQRGGGSSGGNARSYGFLLGSPLPFDVVVTALTLWKAWQHRNAGVLTDVLDLLIKDGLLYFAAITCLNIVNLIFLLQPDPSLQPVNIQMTLIATSMLSQRMILHLRRDRDGAHAVGLRGSSYAPNQASVARRPSTARPSTAPWSKTGSFAPSEKQQTEICESPQGRGLGVPANIVWHSDLPRGGAETLTPAYGAESEPSFVRGTRPPLYAAREGGPMGKVEEV